MLKNVWMKRMSIFSIILIFTGIVIGALNIEASRYGYLIVLPGTVILSALAYMKNDGETFIVFLLLTTINIVGVIRWLIII